LIITQFILFLSALHSSAHGRLFHPHGEKIIPESLLARAESNGHKNGTQRDKDSMQDGKRYIDKTKKDQNEAFDRYVLVGD
jgi:hypothetical protein